MDLSNPYVAGVFAHEALHEWQRQNGVPVTLSAAPLQILKWLTRDSYNPYNYEKTDDPDKLLQSFLNGNVERQGQIWQDFVTDELNHLPTNRYRDVFNYIRDPVR